MSDAAQSKIHIADIIFAIAGLTSTWVWKDEEHFRGFRSHEPSEVVLKLHYGRPPAQPPGGEIVPSVSGVRTIYLSQDRWAYEFNPRDRMLVPERPPRQLLTFDRRFTRGDLYISTGVISGPPILTLGLFLYDLLLSMLPFHNGMMVHASGISDGGRGIVFAGHSGVGKSTMAGLWQECDGVRILHDDRIILRKNGGRWWAHPVPGIGEFRPSYPEGVPLETVFLVSHAAENQARRKGISEAATSLLGHISLLPHDLEAVNLGLRLLDDLLGEVPAYELGFVPDEAVVNYVRDTLSQNRCGSGVRRETL